MQSQNWFDLVQFGTVQELEIKQSRSRDRCRSTGNYCVKRVTDRTKD